MLLMCSDHLPTKAVLQQRFLLAEGIGGGHDSGGYTDLHGTRDSGNVRLVWDWFGLGFIYIYMESLVRVYMGIIS